MSQFQNSILSGDDKNRIIENMQWLASQIGKEISIIDRISAVKGNYDRHFTRTNRHFTRIIHFAIRTSGAIATIEGETLVFEFKTDYIQRIQRMGNELEIELNIDFNTSRLISIEVLS